MIKTFQRSVTPALHAGPHDILRKSGESTLQLVRGGSVIGTAALGAPVLLENGEVLTARKVTFVFEALEVDLANSLKISDVQHNPDGTKSITFPSGSGVSNLSVEALDAMADLVFQEEWQLAFMVARWRAASPTYATDDSISGKTLEVHPDSDLNPLAIGEV